jgi:hypothetical protein
MLYPFVVDDPKLARWLIRRMPRGASFKLALGTPLIGRLPSDVVPLDRDGYVLIYRLNEQQAYHLESAR